jgi:hypothetical protein
MWHGLPAREDTAKPVLSIVEGMAVPPEFLISQQTTNYEQRTHNEELASIKADKGCLDLRESYF